jgi:hypothetical protein
MTRELVVAVRRGDDDGIDGHYVDLDRSLEPDPEKSICDVDAFGTSVCHNGCHNVFLGNISCNYKYVVCP